MSLGVINIGLQYYNGIHIGGVKCSLVSQIKRLICLNRTPIWYPMFPDGTPIMDPMLFYGTSIGTQCSLWNSWRSKVPLWDSYRVYNVPWWNLWLWESKIPLMGFMLRVAIQCIVGPMLSDGNNIGSNVPLWDSYGTQCSLMGLPSW